MASMETRVSTWCRILAPSVAGAMAAATLAFGQTGTPKAPPSPQPAAAPVKLPSFDVVSVKQNMSGAATYKLAFTSDGLAIENVSLLHIIRAAYGMFNSLDDKFIGIPGWASTENFDIQAKVADADVAVFQKLNFDKRQLMVQALLADRFKLQAHHETRDLPIYELVTAKSGPTLQLSKSADPGGAVKRERGRITGQNAVMYQLATALTDTLGRTVVDKTGVQGKYDFALIWTPDEADTPPSQSPNAAAQPPDASGPSIFTAIQEQLGLKLVPAKGPVEVLVIDHVEHPSAN